MGQTLTHGIYLPDEGERNCYDGLASNWSILDGAVGTIAEHTTQIAGKAPLVHTHGKADITDLFNSANEWTGENTFTANNINFKRSFTLGDSSYNICRLQYQDASLTRWGTLNFIHNTDNSVNCDIGVIAKKENDTVNINASIRLTIKPNNSAELIPLNNNKINLGSSNYQWNNLYSKGYYYNGVAWGLDKANVWTNTNTFQQNITYERTNFFHQAPNPCYFLKDTVLEKGSLTSVTHSAYMGNWQDKNGVNLGYVRFVEYDTGKQTAEIRVSNLIKNGTLDPTGSTVNCTVDLVLQPSGEKSLIPEQNNDINLGTSTNRWKTFNGINPGALSLPQLDYANANKYVDISGSLTTTGSDNWYTPAVDGWVFLIVKNSPTFANILVFVTPRGTAPAKFIAGSGGVIESSTNAMWCGCPAPAGSMVRIRIKNGTIEQAVFVTCQGNA